MFILFYFFSFTTNLSLLQFHMQQIILLEKFIQKQICLQNF